MKLLILSLLLSFNVSAQHNSDGNMNADNVKTVKYNLCLEGKKYFQDKSGALTEAGVGACSMDKLPKWDQCMNGIAEKYDRATKKYKVVKNGQNDQTCTED